MSEPTRELLARALGSTLEEAAFVFTEAGSPPPPFDGKVLEARITYQGPRTGELRLTTGRGMASTLAANLLGEEEGEEVERRGADAIGELLNMLVGSLVVELFGDDTRCRLGVPRVEEREPGAYLADLKNADCAAHLVDEEGRRNDLSLAERPDLP
jgi:hypothetical protein